MEIEVEEGDLLYFPRSTIHQVPDLLYALITKSALRGDSV
jgi:ribosomal protein L16 Arg81 hydroxylase